MTTVELTTEMIKGRKKLVTLIVLFIIFSIATEIFSYSTFKFLTTKNIFVFMIRTGLEIGLFFAIYYGKNWARYVLIALFAIGIIGGFVGIIGLLKASLIGLIVLPIIILFTYAIYLLTMDKDFLAFFEYQIDNSEF